MSKNPTIKIHVLHTGKVCVSPGLPFRDVKKNPTPVQLSILTPYGRKNRIWIPVSCYLIEHPKGLVLFDTGWSREMSPEGNSDKKAQIKHLGRLHYYLNQGVVPTGEAVDEQLSAMGIKTSDLDYVIMSHMHSDHASGLKLVKDAKKILLSEEEYSDINGLTAMKVNHNGKYVLLFSDGGYAEKSWKELIPPGTALDIDMSMKSLQWIRDMSLNKNCVEALANHDSDVNPHVIILS